MPEPEESLERAQQLWEQHGEELLRDERTAVALARLSAAAAEVRRKTREARMDRICQVCGELTGGGCCGASVARQADAVLLLVNRLLLGKPALPQHDDFTTCRYLGAHGCALVIKPLLCEKYDCRDMLASIDPRRLEAVRAAREQLMDAWLAVAERVAALCGEDS